MIKVGVQTKGILPEMDLQKGVELIAAAGFEKVDFNLDAFLKNSDVYAGKINTFFDEDLAAYFFVSPFILQILFQIGFPFSSWS